MKMLGKLLGWYFSRTMLPYWVLVVFDGFQCFFGGLFFLWLLHPASELLSMWPGLLHTWVAFLTCSLIGFRVFHTYSGILRYSQFIDLLRVCCAGGLSLLLAMVFMYLCRQSGWGFFFQVLPLRQVVFVYLGTTALLCGSRVLIKLLYEGAQVGGRACNALIYGTYSGAVALTNNIRSTKPAQFRIRGYIGDERPRYRERLMGKRIYSIFEDLRPLLRRERIGAVLVSPLKHEDFVKNREFQELLMDAGVKIYISRNAEEWKVRKDPHEEVRLREVEIEDLLPREEIQIDMAGVGSLLRGRKVLITGSAGSIGSELVRQIAPFGPSELMLIDQAETPQHDIRLQMRNDFPDIPAQTVVTSICRADRMEEIFGRFRPDYVFHAAAYKHVPMMEDNPSESVFNNVWGTRILADLSVKYGVRKFVMVSTDKAVNPTNVMGCSKRICEMYVQSLDQAIKEGLVKGVTRFVTTRFGNVLGSNGSVIPLFRRQLASGGPLTVTHPDIIRYFMLIPEACKLVLEAGTHGQGGEVFVFDMGEPVRIADLARRMIRLSGAKNVDIRFTGLREGEKLYEEVLSQEEVTKPSFHKKIRIADVRRYSYEEVVEGIGELYRVASLYDDMGTVRQMKRLVPEYISRHSRYEALDAER